MKKIAFSLSLIISLVFGFIGYLPALAKDDPVLASDEDVIYLGKKIDPQTNREVEGYKFIHYKNEQSQRAERSRKPRGTVCYSYLADGAKWKVVEPWVMNAQNTEGLNETELFNLESVALEKWEDAADGAVGNGLGVQIFGSGTLTSSQLAADQSAPDGLNEVYFGDAGGAGVIAVTTVWGVYGGPVEFRYLAEWDQIYDQADFDWSTSGDPTKMDFDNIVSHEVGHAAGMGHPSSTCIEETMYAYAANGETKKRTLNTGDITGINNLY